MDKKQAFRLGFDAKRAFFNHSGLGNYSRDVIRILSANFPSNSYFLFKPKDKKGIDFELNSNTHVVVPQKTIYKKLGAAWRYFGVSDVFKKLDLDIYHGLSHDLPFGVQRSGVKTVITIHDCIYLRYPEFYDASSRWIYTKKQAYACKVADRIIAISEQTKQDVITYFQVPEEKIDVVYQGCHSMFYGTEEIEHLDDVKKKYKLPSNYLLFVGSIEERKNLLGVLEGMVDAGVNIPVVAVGRYTTYVDKVRDYADVHHLDLICVHGVDFEDLPAIYQASKVFVYPSAFEGFGRPILEAFESGVPVITTEGGVFPETGGDAACYVPYGDSTAMGCALVKLLGDDVLRSEMIVKGKVQALKFRDEVIAQNLDAVYRKVLK